MKSKICSNVLIFYIKSRLRWDRIKKCSYLGKIRIYLHKQIHPGCNIKSAIFPFPRANYLWLRHNQYYCKSQMRTWEWSSTLCCWRWQPYWWLHLSIWRWTDCGRLSSESVELTSIPSDSSQNRGPDRCWCTREGIYRRRSMATVSCYSSRLSCRITWRDRSP